MTGREIAAELRKYAVVMADHNALRSAAVCRVAADRLERMEDMKNELTRLRAEAQRLNGTVAGKGGRGDEAA